MGVGVGVGLLGFLGVGAGVGVDIWKIEGVGVGVGVGLWKIEGVGVGVGLFVSDSATLPSGSLGSGGDINLVNSVTVNICHVNVNSDLAHE